MRVSHNPESPSGDRGNGPETRPGGEQERMYPQTNEPPKGNPRPEGRGGGQTIYASQLRTRAESPVHREDYVLALMETVRVSECRIVSIKVSAWDRASDAATLMREKGFTSLPVVGIDGEFLGVVYLKDLERAAGDDIVLKYTIEKPQYVAPSSTILEAVEKMSGGDAGWVAVVENGRFLGIITPASIMEVYRGRARGS